MRIGRWARARARRARRRQARVNRQLQRHPSQAATEPYEYDPSQTLAEPLAYRIDLTRQSIPSPSSPSLALPWPRRAVSSTDTLKFGAE